MKAHQELNIPPGVRPFNLHKIATSSPMAFIPMTTEVVSGFVYRQRGREG